MAWGTRTSLWVGATKAIDDYFEGKNVKIVKSPIFRHYLVKE